MMQGAQVLRITIAAIFGCLCLLAVVAALTINPWQWIIAGIFFLLTIYEAHKVYENEQ